MDPLFKVNCSAALARALGARPMSQLERPHLSFRVFDPPATHHAQLQTEAGPFAWLWLLDGIHHSITRQPRD